MAFMIAVLHFEHRVKPMLVALERTRDEKAFTELANERVVAVLETLRGNHISVPSAMRLAIGVAIGEDKAMGRLRDALLPVYGPRMGEGGTLQ